MTPPLGRPAIEIPASFGPEYELSITPTKCLRLARQTKNGGTACLIFSPRDAIAVADALVDAVEGVRREKDVRPS